MTCGGYSARPAGTPAFSVESAGGFGGFWGGGRPPSRCSTMWRHLAVLLGGQQAGSGSTRGQACSGNGGDRGRRPAISSIQDSDLASGSWWAAGRCEGGPEGFTRHASTRPMPTTCCAGETGGSWCFARGFARWARFAKGRIWGRSRRKRSTVLPWAHRGWAQAWLDRRWVPTWLLLVSSAWWALLPRWGCGLSISAP